MTKKLDSVLVIGFNTRPLVYSLYKAGYKVYAVDFFGDLDLFPYVEDNIIVLKELESNYHSLKENYSNLLAHYAVKLLKKYRDIKYLLIGSGLDDAYDEREQLLDEIKNSITYSVNNDLQTIKKSRDIKFLLNLLKSHGFKIPLSMDFNFGELDIEFPYILKKPRSAGGINVHKIRNSKALRSQIKNLKMKKFIPSEWIVQEYIEGIPISCTVISNGKECQIISINEQIIGTGFLNAPKDFMYCGNIVPVEISKEEEKIITDISIFLTKELGLKGINGFDFVLKDHYPYFMECNPRIPGSIRASESVMDLNLLDLQVKSFLPNGWKEIKTKLKSIKINGVATKLIYFAPKDIPSNYVSQINKLKYIHDKSKPAKNILKGEPLCTVLYKAKNSVESFKGAKEVINKINAIIK